MSGKPHFPTQTLYMYRSVGHIGRGWSNEVIVDAAWLLKSVLGRFPITYMRNCGSGSKKLSNRYIRSDGSVHSHGGRPKLNADRLASEVRTAIQIESVSTDACMPMDGVSSPLYI